MNKNVMILLMLLKLSGVLAQKITEPILKIQIKPSSGGKNGYVIDVSESLLNVKLTDLIVENADFAIGKTHKNSELKLSNHQFKKVVKYINKINDIPQFKEYKGFSLDSWEFEVIKGKNTYFFDINDLAENSELKQMKKLIEYLKKISPIKIIMR